MENKINVLMPNSYDLVVGDTFQLYYRGIIQSSNPYKYEIVATCEKGKHFPRYFEFTPTETGKYNLNVSLYDDNLNLVASADTILNVVKPAPSKKPINVLVIGDSYSSSGDWINEVYRKITESENGLGFSNLKFVGKVNKGEINHEAYGGFEWRNFSSPRVGGITLEVKHDKTEEDQHSIWKDENGALWQLETVERDYLKFNRYLDHKSPRPERGTLYHEKNAINQNPILFNTSWTRVGSPFVNSETGKIDFNNYLKEINEKEIDVVYAFLGANGLLRPEAVKNTREYYCKNVLLKEAKEVIDIILNACPNVKIKVVSCPFISNKGGLGSNYGANPPFNSYLNLVNYYMTMGKTYKDWADEEKYKDKLEYVNISSQYDSEHNLPHVFKPVNVRSTETEWFDVNGGHPTKCGYKQIADAIYRNLVKECFSEK